MGLIVDNTVAVSAIRQRQRRGHYEMLPLWLLLISFAAAPLAAMVAGGRFGGGLAAGQLLFLFALGGYILWFFHALVETCDPMALAVRDGTFDQWIVTGISPGEWVVGGVMSFLFDGAILTLAHVPVFALCCVLGGVSAISAIVSVAAVWFAALNLFLLGGLFSRRPGTALLMTAVLSTATVLSFVLVFRNDLGADGAAATWLLAAGSPSPVCVLALEACGRWLRADLVTELRSPLSFGSLRVSATSLFFISNGLLASAQLLATAVGPRSSILPHAVEDLIGRRRRFRASAADDSVSAGAQGYGLAVAIRLFQENRGSVWRLFEDAVVMATELVVFTVCLGYFLATGLALCFSMNAGWLALPVFAVIVSFAGVACGNAACFRGSALRYRPRRAGWWRSPAWSVLSAAAKCAVVTLASAVGALVFGSSGFDAATRTAAGQLILVMPFFAVFCVTVGLLASTIRREHVLAVRDTAIVCLCWLCAPLLFLLLVHLILPMLPGLAVVSSLSPLLPSVLCHLEDGALIHRYSDGTALVTDVAFNPFVFAYAVGAASMLCLLTAAVRVIVLVRTRKEGP